ncbi:MAG: hypothetical protein KC483_08350 [Nitrosarchaeum sp.]|nr:hypothetical protein [Nitrosarchaeum sp.]
MSDELEKLTTESHENVSVFDFDNFKVPCIIMDENKYDELISKIAGKPVSINTDLNIMQDGLGHVFVEIVLTFSKGGTTEKILINANKHLNFFQSLAGSSMLALSSPKSHYGKENVFMIQLPRPEKANDALKIISQGLEKINK